MIVSKSVVLGLLSFGRSDALFQSYGASSKLFHNGPLATQGSLATQSVAVSETQSYRFTDHLQINRSVFTYELFKRAIDLVGATTLLIILSPLMLGICAAVALTSRGPVIYKQNRLTLGGREFTLLKFRSMRMDAELGTGAIWAQKQDPRITPIGAFLRRSRLDELPQLINVIAGEMSLIGPRPERPELAKELMEAIPSFKRRTEVRAGITGLAQVVSGYPATARGYKNKVALDVLYIERRSIWLDAKIAARTVWVVLTGKGAH